MNMGKHVKQNGIFIPQSMAKEYLATSMPIPFSSLQGIINNLFYNQDDSPLNHLRTLGSDDPLLPRARAVDFLNNQKGFDEVHEIGPGNFNFAINFLETPGLEEVVYNAHDFSESSFVFVKNKLEKYGKRVKFHNNSLSKFSEEVRSDSVNLSLVELLDDTRTEFFTMHEGKEYEMWMVPEIKAGINFPSKAKIGKEKVLGGQFSLEVQRLIESESLYDSFSSEDVISALEKCDMKKLRQIHPIFLRAMGYKNHEFVARDLEGLYNGVWKGKSSDFKSYGDEIIRYFREELKQAENIRRDRNDPSPYILTLPVEGLNLLWELKDRKKVNIDIFDYGRDSLDYWVEAFSLHSGQITAPVNFRIMKHVAEVLGYKTKLETNREYIKRNLGEDTITVGYASRPIKGRLKGNIGEKLYDIFSKDVRKLSPNIECTPENISSLRIRRSAYEIFLKIAKQNGLVSDDYKESDGSFHLQVRK